MYQQHPDGWVKHLDFMVLDLLLVVLSFWAAYGLTRGSWDILLSDLYLNIEVILPLFHFIGALCIENYRDILRRGTYEELVCVLRAVSVDTVAVILYQFLFRRQPLSRTTVCLFCILGGVLLFTGRLCWKKVLAFRRTRNPYNKNHLLVISHSKLIGSVLRQAQENSFGEYEIIGFVVVDDGVRHPKRIRGVPEACAFADAANYMVDKWVDEVLFCLPKGADVPDGLMDACADMGITTHIRLDVNADRPGMHTVEKFAGYTVMTESRRIASVQQVFLKRLMDICGALAGLAVTGVLTVLVGPAIYFSDPGPIFFSQPRIGKNGRVFRLYKFRSMYRDAENMKQELMDRNKMRDGMMFKIDADPRVLGSGPDGTRHGIGWFIRRTSIDEFPQFWNVLRGELSLVGTRPPLLDEWERYEGHHRARMSIRPGITGLWQVSGRSNIQDFEEVIALDMAYINSWSIREDVKILMKTLKILLTGEGAQ